MVVYLICIYIWIGDDGMMGLSDMFCVVKIDVWLVVYVDCDEVNVVIGVVLVLGYLDI